MNAAVRLDMRGISKSYTGTQALLGVDFSACGGEVHAIAGENGAGKSTLVKILTGAVQASAGRIFLDDTEVKIVSPRHAHRLSIRSVHQHLSLVPNLSVAENVLLGSLPSKLARPFVDWNRARTRAAELLRSVGLGERDVRTPVSRLGVAQQQMVEVAKALAEDPRILILDEPSSVLTKQEIDRLFGLIRRLRNERVLVIYISHRLEEVFNIADRVTVLKDGRLVGTVNTADTDKQSLIRMMIGRKLDDLFPSRDCSPREEVLHVRDLALSGVFRDISFSVGKGEIVGMYGLVGSGRTEIARCVYGADRASSGTVDLHGRPFRPTSPRDALSAGIAMLTEDRARDGLVLFLPTIDNASFAVMRSISHCGVLDVRRQRRDVTKMVERLRIRPPRLRIPVESLSGGNQQKVVLAKWLLFDAPCLILDEPTRGVDVGTKQQIYGIVRELADRGVAILFISSEMPEVLGMSDRILVTREGRIVDEVARTDATEERLLSSAAGITSTQ